LIYILCLFVLLLFCFFFFQAEDGIRDRTVTGVQTCALPIYSVHWRGRRGCRWNHQPVSVAADDLARIERRARGSARRSKVDGRRATYRSRHVDESRHGRDYRADRFDHAVPTVESSVQSDWRNSDRRVWLFVRNRVVAPDRRDWFLVKSNLRHDGRDATAHLPDLFSDWLDGAELLHHRAIDW